MLLILLINVIQSNIYSQVRLILTAALSDAHFAWRKSQYIKSFNQIYTYGYRKNDFYIVEALKKHGPTFLDEYCNHVYYAQNNNPNFKNNGINEAITLLEAFNHFNFNDDDIIIKMTGRHFLMNDNFLTIVKKNQNDTDAVILYREKDHCVATTLIAMKYKYFREFLENLNYTLMEQNWIVLERAVGEYIERKMKDSHFKIIFVSNLGIEANIFGSTTAPGASGTIYQ